MLGDLKRNIYKYLLLVKTAQNIFYCQEAKDVIQ